MSFRKSTADAAQGFSATKRWRTSSPANISETAKEFIRLLDGKREKIFEERAIFPLFLDAGLSVRGVVERKDYIKTERALYEELSTRRGLCAPLKIEEENDGLRGFWPHNIVAIVGILDSFDANVVKKFNDKQKIESFRKIMKIKEYKELADLFFKWIYLNSEEISKYFPPLTSAEKATQLKRLKEYENKFRRPIVSAVREYMERAEIAPEEGFEKPAIDCETSI